ncbi:MBOAT family protein [Prevotella sp. OH937_COT-195]|nr:MBOAT family protein [Prevotella sp. OH937_COT-195]RRC99526.1 MBOAT family protein [Prevotella sp. OH937_COT-195]
MMENIARVLEYDSEQPMIFSSGMFLWLFLGFTFIYMLLQRKLMARLVFVTLFSYFFYYKSSGIYFMLLAVVTASDWLIGRQMGKIIERNPDDKRKTGWLVALSVIIDLSLLAYFKYTNFFLGSLSQIIDNNFQPLDIFLPVGISFFTFQSLSYTIDIYRREICPLDSLLDYAFFVSFFPQLVAGPIVKARDFVPQIRKPLQVTRRMFGMGVYLIIIGLFKKAVISDYISINFVERVFDHPEMFSGLEVLLGIYGYALQIYCDFSGYSDMAIGIALLLGFRFPMNFNAPYRAVSVTDFWRRWHISLSTWLKQYLYISLGGNRKGKLKTYLNLTITMLLGGLWHGASWNFIFWGALHGLALSIHKFFSQEILHHDKSYTGRGWRRVAAVILTFHFVCFCWIFFRSSDLETSITIVTQIVSNFHPELFLQVVSGYPWVFGLMLFGFVSHFLPDRWQSRIIARLSMTNVMVGATLITAVIYIVIQVKSSDIQPFIYFQF